jgi:hypothetical protein
MANGTRKTSLGMQAIGHVPPPADLPRGEIQGRDGGAHAMGIGVTLILHLAIAGTVIFMNELDRSHVERSQQEPEFTAIEAGLAMKKKTPQGKKSALPQKEVAAKVKPPEAPGVSKNADAVPKENKDKKEKRPDFVPPEATDSKSIFDKYRHVDTGDTQGGDKADVNQNGSDEGSEFGTLDRAKGDPYIGELIGRMTVDFVVPTVVRDQNLVTWGCVKLDENGKIIDRAIAPEKKSRSHAFNSAVEERLKLTTDMDKPVPSHLKKTLLGKYVCATYTSRTE